MRYSKILLIPGGGWTVKPINGLNHTETMTYLYLVKQGYKAIKLSPNRELSPEQKSELTAINIPTSIIKPGVPDFVCWKGKKVLFVEVKGGKVGLSQAQANWIEAFSDIYDILTLRVKFDEKDYLKSKGLTAIEGVIIDRYTSKVETLDNLEYIESGTKIANPIWGEEDLAATIPKTKNINPEKTEEWVYYHLIAMEYSDAVIEDAKAKISTLLSPKNKDPEKYKEAYKILRDAIDKSQKLLIEHREKAKTRISGDISENRLYYILKKRVSENQSLEKIYLKKEKAKTEIKFKTGLELLNEAETKEDKKSQTFS
ncbi:MAG: VRR-NUC domain-containing protein [Candidatus Micrarchaeaceae archaeon]